MGKITPDRRQPKTLKLSMIVVQKLLATEFSKTLFLVNFDQRLLINKSVFSCHLSGVKILFLLHYKNIKSVVVTSP